MANKILPAHGRPSHEPAGPAGRPRRGIDMATWHHIYVQSGRVETFCCQEFKKIFKFMARRASKKFAEQNGLSRKGKLQRGKCPRADEGCR